MNNTRRVAPSWYTAESVTHTTKILRVKQQYTTHSILTQLHGEPLGDHTLPASPWTREVRKLRSDCTTPGTKGTRRPTLPRMRCSGPTRYGRKPSTHTWNAFLDPHAVRKDSTVRATTRADVRPTITRVQGFEMTKQKHNNETENVTILLEEKFRTYRQNQGPRDRRRRTTT